MKKIISLIVVLGILCLTSCSVNPTDEITNELKNIKIGETLDNGFASYVNEDGVEVSFSSSHPNILDNDGYFHIPYEDTEITVYVTLSYNGKTEQADYETIALSSVTGAIDSAVSYVRSLIPSEVTNNLKFGVASYQGIKIKYTSLNLDIIGEDGKINQKVASQETQVRIDYTNENKRVMYSEIRDVTVKGYSDQTLVYLVNEWLKDQLNQLIEGNIENLPTTHPEYGTSITWFSTTAGFVTNDGIANVPMTFQNIKVSATVTNGTISNTFIHNLENVGGNTYERYINKWLVQIIPTRITGVVNHVYKEYASSDELYLEYQEVVNYGGVLNLLDGKTLAIDKTYYIDTTNPTSLKNRLFSTYTSRAVPQADLDSLFYPGYQIPNDNDILWIVVHESGMPREGQNAELLAKLQWNNAYVTEDPRVASWHYQVDEGKIYQSFDDNIYAWHAGGTYTNLPYGNRNSIGIEMCINVDGNYEGSMRNDAKLIAYLLHKYNLNLDNVKRHYDFSLKECPSYMIRTNRWLEFLGLVAIEYQAIELLKNATITWEIDPVLLNTYFVKGDNNLYYNKAVSSIVDIPITVKVVQNGYTHEASNTLKLYPTV